MRRILQIIIIMMFVIPLITSVNAEVLIQIEEEDTWTYEVTSSPTKFVSFEVINIDYLGESEDLIRVNEVITNDTIETPKINSIASIPLFVNCSYYGVLGSADMDISIENVVSDVVWRTARGNILYQRETIIDTVLYFTNIDFNNTIHSNWQTNVILTFFETISNPTIIEPLSTGTVKLNYRIITINGVIQNEDFFGLGLGLSDIEIYFEITETERYEASDLFTYMDTDCRNLTIRPLDAYITESRFTTDYFSFYTLEEVDLETTLGTTEDWIYSFEAGLPLLIVETAEIVALSKEISISVLETVKTMKLVDISLVNSDYEFLEEPIGTTKTSYYTMLSLLMATYVIFYLKKKKRQ